MTEFGEGVAMGLQRGLEGRCPLCGEKHDKPKPGDDPLPVKSGAEGWMRAPGMTPRDGCDPAGNEMHHAVALSAFNVSRGQKPRDFLPALNRVLHAAGYQPNRARNCAALPARDHPQGPYGHFCARIDAGRPRQLHIGRHQSGALNASKAMMVHMLVHLAGEAADCALSTAREDAARINRLIGKAEDYAYDRTLRYIAPFQLHPAHLIPACRAHAVGLRGEGRDAYARELATRLVQHWASLDTGVSLRGNPFARLEG